MEKLKVELPLYPENTQIGESAYLTCPGCKGEFTRLTDKGYCLDCEEKAINQERERVKRDQFVETRLGSKGAKEFIFETYKQGSGNLDAYNACLGFNPMAHNLYLFGSCGTGKTHLAGAAWRNRLEAGLKCEFIKHPELSRLFRKREGDEEAALLKKFAEFDVLVIDDIGVGRSTEFSNQILYEILDARVSNYRNGLILTSNLSLEEFAAKVGDDRLPSRIGGICKSIKIDGRDHRLK